MHVDEKEILGGGCTPLRALLLSSPSPPHPHTLPPTLGQSLAFHFPSTIHIPKIPTPLFPCWACGPPPRGVAWHPDKEPIANDRKIREWIRPVELGKRPRRRDHQTNYGVVDPRHREPPLPPALGCPIWEILGSGSEPRLIPFASHPTELRLTNSAKLFGPSYEQRQGRKPAKNLFSQPHTSQI